MSGHKHYELHAGVTDYTSPVVTAPSLMPMHSGHSCHQAAGWHERSASPTDREAAGGCISPLRRNTPCRHLGLGRGMLHKMPFSSLRSQQLTKKGENSDIQAAAVFVTGQPGVKHSWTTLRLGPFHVSQPSNYAGAGGRERAKKLTQFYKEWLCFACNQNGWTCPHAP